MMNQQEKSQQENIRPDRFWLIDAALIRYLGIWQKDSLVSFYVIGAILAVAVTIDRFEAGIFDDFGLMGVVLAIFMTFVLWILSTVAVMALFTVLVIIFNLFFLGIHQMLEKEANHEKDPGE